MAEASGEIRPALAAALKAETDARMADGSFYGAILFVSLIAVRA
jgi:hypothetical protein